MVFSVLIFLIQKYLFKEMDIANNGRQIDYYFCKNYLKNLTINSHNLSLNLENYIVFLKNPGKYKVIFRFSWKN